MGSRLLGFVRDLMVANHLGASAIADAFLIAFKLPNFFRKLTAEGAFSIAFVPMFSKILSGEGTEEAKKFAEEAQAVMLAVLIPFTVLMVAAMPFVLYVIAPGVHGDPSRYELALHFSRVTFPYLAIMSVAALMGAVMNSFDRFAPFAAAPILFNLVAVLMMLFGLDLFETAGHALSWAIVIAGVVQFLWLLWFLWKMNFVIHFRLPQVTERMKQLFRVMGPGVVGAGALQINIFIDMILVSFLPIGSISYLYYADRMYQLPLGIIGVAIGTALLPMLSRALKNPGKDEQDPVRLMGVGFETALALSLPAAVALVVIAYPVMSVLFARGEFSVEDALQSSYALMGYAAGIPAFVLVKVFSTPYFARHDTKTPVTFAIICIGVNIFLSLLLIGPLKHAGIALGTGLTAWVNLGLLVWTLKKRDQLQLPARSVKKMFSIIGSAVAMGFLLWTLERFVLQTLLQGSEIERIFALGLLVAAGGGFYFVLLFTFKVMTVVGVKALFQKTENQATIGQGQEQRQGE